MSANPDPKIRASLSSQTYTQGHNNNISILEYLGDDVRGGGVFTTERRRRRKRKISWEDREEEAEKAAEASECTEARLFFVPHSLSVSRRRMETA